MTDDLLIDVGCPYVTVGAARRYQQVCGLDELEQARRELTRHVSAAKMTHAAIDGRPEQWRYRSRAAGIDITAQVSHEDGLAIVVSVSVRTMQRGTSKDRRRRRQQ